MTISEVKNSFEFSTAGNIIFGSGTASRVPSLISQWEGPVLFVTGSTPERWRHLIEALNHAGLPTSLFTVSGEPAVESVRACVEQARRDHCTTVLAVGGGSVLDTGKAVAALITNDGDIMDYLEVVGKGSPLTAPSAPFIAMPTTAGTGTEVTRNAVITSTQHGVKVSMRSPYMIPRIAIVDPELTLSMPPAVTASTGLDALTQLIEAFVSVSATPLTDALCREGIRRAASSLIDSYSDGSNLRAREGMALASLTSGMALANARLGAVHGFAGPLGGMYSISHGVVCASLLPHVMKANVAAANSRLPGSPVPARFDEIARILTGDSNALAMDGVAWIEKTCRIMGIPSLGGMGIEEKDIAAIREQAKKASSMKGNPVELTDHELDTILRSAL